MEVKVIKDFLKWMKVVESLAPPPPPPRKWLETKTSQLDMEGGRQIRREWLVILSSEAAVLVS